MLIVDRLNRLQGQRPPGADVVEVLIEGWKVQPGHGPRLRRTAQLGVAIWRVSDWPRLTMRPAAQGASAAWAYLSASAPGPGLTPTGAHQM